MMTSLAQKMKLPTTTGPTTFSGESHLLRQLSTFSTTTPPPSHQPYHHPNNTPPKNRISKQNLFRMLFALGPTTGVDDQVSKVLYGVIHSGKDITRTVLVECVKDLRRLGRHHHCLQILDWVVKGRYDYSVKEYALRLKVLCELKGIDEVEKYFDSIPSDAKTQATYGALLNCYCSERATDKALALFEKMDEMNFAGNILAFNNIICLYLKVGQPEKVPGLVEEMKQRNIPPNNYTYSFWIQSYRHLRDLEGVERVIHEVQEQDLVKDDWVIYSSVAAAYIEVGQSEKAIQSLEKLEDILDNSDNPDRNAYNHLISLYAGAGKLESVIQAWDKFKSKFKVHSNLSYLNMLQALANLDDMEGLKKYLTEWESSYRTYDDRLPAVLVGAHLKHDMVEEAELLLKDVTKKSGQLVRAVHVKFLNYYIEKGQIDSALVHMEAAIASKWKPNAKKLDPFFLYFKEQKDVEGAEKFCRLLKKAQPLDATAYLWLLQTYAAAGKAAPEMRLRMEQEGVQITPEHEELLQKVCADEDWSETFPSTTA